MKTANIPGFTAEASLYTSSRRYRTAGKSGGAGRRGVVPQADDTIWTKSTICEACGCTVSGFQCNCGLNPQPRKVECIKNGGPGKTVSLGTTFTTGGTWTTGGVFQGGVLSRRF